MAWADLLERRGDAAAVDRAIQLEPLNARSRIAAAAMRAGPGSDATLQAALAHNPRDSEGWMALGLRAEAAGENRQAEKYLLKAAQVSHLLKPAWTLANFYARTNQIGKFWPWMHRCLELAEPQNEEVATFDTRPFFELCWNVSDDSAQILRLAIPGQRYVLTEYVGYLVATQRLEAAARAAELSYPLAIPRDTSGLLALCESLIMAGRSQDAVDVWNGLSRRGLITQPPFYLQERVSLTNGDLAKAPLRRGFDWHFARPVGVSDSYSPNRHELRFDFNGEEAENCELVAQFLPVLPGRTYSLTSKTETSGIPEGSGLHWYVAGLDTKKYTAYSMGLQGEFQFAVPAHTDLVRLSLRYDRLPGDTRPAGWLKLTGVQLGTPR